MTIGVDEVGLGSIAGPVVVAAVALKRGVKIEGVRDSKKLSDSVRRSLVPKIKEDSVHWVIAGSSAKAIDKFGLRRCKLACMREAVQRCLDRIDEDYEVIVDGVDPIPGVDNLRCVVKADDKIVAVSAASVIAKVYRDDYMLKVASKYPGYWFHKHVGYVTQRHLRALDKLGPCPEHRMSTGPLRKTVRNCVTRT